MTAKEFLTSIEREAKSLLNKSSKVGITKTFYVPNVEDQGFNLGMGEILKAKVINTCVLFIDIRKSTQLNFKHTQEDLARLYATFVKSMLKAAEFFGGKVRNINGDRVMVVFDTADCFYNAIYTATLMNTISENIINKYFTQDAFECGIGIDYGEMLVVKTGTVKQGDENQFYKSFVWLGKPANLASKLCDLANKENATIKLKYLWYDFLAALGANRGRVGFPLQRPTQIKESVIDLTDFAEKLTKLDQTSKTKYGLYEAISWVRVKTKAKPILITEEVYKGLLKDHPQNEFFTNRLFTTSTVKVSGYSGKVYGADTYF